MKTKLRDMLCSGRLKCGKMDCYHTAPHHKIEGSESSCSVMRYYCCYADERVRCTVDAIVDAVVILNETKSV